MQYVCFFGMVALLALVLSINEEWSESYSKLNEHWAKHCPELNRNWAEMCERQGKEWHDKCAKQNEEWGEICRGHIERIHELELELKLAELQKEE